MHHLGSRILDLYLVFSRLLGRLATDWVLFKVQDPGSRILQPVSSVQDSGYNILDPGSWVCNTIQSVVDVKSLAEAKIKIPDPDS